ncbi:MAG: DUF4430 domain-containing protein [Clostridiales bacterium]|nr:DUF4430 domain-containing protein [Clostridiales bacterium]
MEKKLKSQKLRKYALIGVACLVVIGLIVGTSITGKDVKEVIDPEGEVSGDIGVIGQTIEEPSEEQQAEDQEDTEKDSKEKKEKSEKKEKKKDKKSEEKKSEEKEEKSEEKVQEQETDKQETQVAPEQKKEDKSSDSSSSKEKKKSDKKKSDSDKKDSKKSEKKSDSDKKDKSKDGDKSKDSKKKDEKKDKKPEPAPEPEPSTITVHIQILCYTLSNDMSQLENEAIRDYIPSNGVILGRTSYTCDQGSGMTVYDALSTVCKNNGVQLDANYRSSYGSVYVEGIGYLYEFDAGPQSGWMYSVNGTFPNYGCSSYELKDGDEIKWLYTCKGIGTDL